MLGGGLAPVILMILDISSWRNPETREFSFVLPLAAPPAFLVRGSQPFMMVQKSFRPLIQATLPNHKYRPSQFFEFEMVGAVEGCVAVQLAVPEFLASGWTPLPLPASMPVPEAALEHDRGLITRQHQVRSAWKAANVQTIAKPRPPNSLRTCRSAALPLFLTRDIRAERPSWVRKSTMSHRLGSSNSLPPTGRPD